MANLYGIILRTGCCCNPGACQRFLGLNDEDVVKHFKVILSKYPEILCSNNIFDNGV